MSKPTRVEERSPLIDRHLRVGWCLVLVFVCLGTGLEALHGFKIGWYVGVSSETRRLMWTLAHAHGTLLGVLNLGFAATAALRQHANPRHLRLASPCLVAASVLVPSGFFLGGCFIYSGDPGFGILLVPVGAAFLVAAVVIVLTS